ncbi:unnamed protein product [Prorocentrum cordatum]|uniref:Protein kinase domain-containing protein n=1 Tax=Prorocentrum cordatum TaxID=2364126 RepID=A0ABN9XCR6_9DINO|nr:unnamed protein product [Polarella glacialis]
MYPPDHPDFDDIYIVTDLMESDLHKVIYSKQVLNDEHHQYFAYQILRGLLYLHSANVVHRDLKPSNILVNKNCDLKICDFGLARGYNVDEDDPNLTDYVVTRWYRAPEVVLLASEYTKSIDVWSVGCILCELIGRKPIFQGKDHLNQIKVILQVLGTPTEADLDWLPPKSPARAFINKIPVCSKQPWSSIYPKATADGVHAIESMLTFHPERRSERAGGHRAQVLRDPAHPGRRADRREDGRLGVRQVHAHQALAAELSLLLLPPGHRQERREVVALSGYRAAPVIIPAPPLLLLEEVENHDVSWSWSWSCSSSPPSYCCPPPRISARAIPCAREPARERARAA